MRLLHHLALGFTPMAVTNRFPRYKASCELVREMTRFDYYELQALKMAMTRALGEGPLE
jgi:hypothetical protein